MPQIWHSNDVNGFADRLPIAVLSSSTANYVSIVAPFGLERLFDQITDATDADDTRIVPPTPNSSATYDVKVWSPSTKSATWVAEYSGAHDTRVECWWLYFGKTGASDDSGAVTETTITNGMILPALPRNAIIVSTDGEGSGAETPGQVVTKGSAEKIMIWFDITPKIGPLDGANIYGRPSSAYFLEYIDFNATTGTGPYVASTLQTAMVDRDATRIVEQDGRLYVGVSAEAGTAGTDYRFSLIGSVKQVGGGVANSMTFDARCLLRVQNPAE